MILDRIYNGLENRIKSYYFQKKDVTLNRHIVVIESDDWGAVRLPSKEVYNHLIKKINLSACHYCANDSILENCDLELLHEVLNSVKDTNGNCAIITANFVTSNPDFERISKEHFETYYNESLLSTLSRYQNIDFLNIRKLINEHCLYPQLHGREHLNINRWMQLLQSGNIDFHMAFKHEMFGLSTTVTNTTHDSVMAAFDSGSISPNILREAVDNFNFLFGFNPQSFIAPNYCWNKEVENILYSKGIEYIQGVRTQLCRDDHRMYNIFHYMGQINEVNQIYLVRNVFFEPSSDLCKDWFNECKKQIENCFKNNHPAIISSHRVNFVGRINKKNRDNSLRQLSQLLKWIVLKWPDVEFMSTNELGEVLKNGIGK